MFRRRLMMRLTSHRQTIFPLYHCTCTNSCVRRDATSPLVRQSVRTQRDSFFNNNYDFCIVSVVNGSAPIPFAQSHHALNVSDMRASIRHYNAMQVVLNEDQFGPLENDSVIIVIQVSSPKF